MEISTETYSVRYDANDQVVVCQGVLRLAGMEEYAPIAQLLDQVVDQHPTALKLNLQQLEFLNSSGINVLSKFVIKVRQQETVPLVVQGSNAIAWQGKSLRNLQRLMPTLELVWE
jgi:hypothetical protein